MKKIQFFLLILFFLPACQHQNKTPDISGIQVDLHVERFENDLFSIDTNSVLKGLDFLIKKYPGFSPVFFGSVLGLPDSSSILDRELRRFISLNRPVYETVEKKYKDLDEIKKEFEKSFRFVKYYFPDYLIPKIITLIGPADAMAKMQNGNYSTDFLGQDFLGVSLQFYLGKDYSLYQVPYFIDNVAPLYRSRRFEKEYIVPDAMKLIVDDLFPDKSAGTPLIEQMIEKGKQWWMLDHFLPATADSLKTGYTKAQLDWCTENEGLIWNYLLTNENIESIDPTTIQNYIGESPTTQGMPKSSPGNIGQWVGWQIVKKFADKNSALKPAEIMNTPARTILTQAKYKPK